MTHRHQSLYLAGLLLVVGLLTQQVNFGRSFKVSSRNHLRYASKYLKNSDSENIPQCDCSCGHATGHGRIVDGQVTSILNYPWMVRLFLNNEHHCGGTLINDKYVLTAAHCVYRPDSYELLNLTASFGKQNYCNGTNIPTPVESQTIERIIVGDFDFKSGKNDIALLELTDRVQFTEATRPICMPTDSNDQYANGNATTAGWGNWAEIVGPTCILLEVNVPILKPSDCRNFNRTKIPRTQSKTQICAGYKDKWKGSCFGDSGGPLMRIMDNNKFEIIGITSYGVGKTFIPECGIPTVYTRVFHYLSWIKENTKNACHCAI